MELLMSFVLLPKRPRAELVKKGRAAYPGMIATEWATFAKKHARSRGLDVEATKAAAATLARNGRKTARASLSALGDAQALLASVSKNRRLAFFEFECAFPLYLAMLGKWKFRSSLGESPTLEEGLGAEDRHVMVSGPALRALHRQLLAPENLEWDATAAQRAKAELGKDSAMAGSLADCAKRCVNMEGQTIQDLEALVARAVAGEGRLLCVLEMPSML